MDTRWSHLPSFNMDTELCDIGVCIFSANFKYLKSFMTNVVGVLCP